MERFQASKFELMPNGEQSRKLRRFQALGSSRSGNILSQSAT
jgi:hypothetical protein